MVVMVVANSEYNGSDCRASYSASVGCREHFFEMAVLVSFLLGRCLSQQEPEACI